MTLVDALTVTALGMTVVFSGLLLVSLLIVTFGFLPSLSKKHLDESSAAPEDASISPTPEDGGVIAVITTILEVERRLHHAEADGRLTIKRSS